MAFMLFDKKIDRYENISRNVIRWQPAGSERKFGFDLHHRDQVWTPT